MIKRIITKFLLISIVTVILISLHTTIYIFYLSEADLNFKEVSFVSLFYLLTLFLFGSHSEIILNLLGKKIALIFSAIFYGIGLWLYTLANNLLGFISAEVFIAASTVLSSGVLKAWLINSLYFYKSNKKRENRFHWKRRIIGFVKLIVSFTSVYLGSEGLSFSFAVIGLGYWFVTILSLFIKEAIDLQETKTKKTSLIDFKMIAQERVAYVWQDDVLFIIIGLTIIIALGFPFISLTSQLHYYAFVFVSCLLAYLSLFGKNILFGRKMTRLSFYEVCRWQPIL